jgi:hypothetical protein
MFRGQSSVAQVRKFVQPVVLAVLLAAPFAAAQGSSHKSSIDDRMSSLGRLASKVRKQLRKAGLAGVNTRSAIDSCVNSPDDCEDGFSEGPAGGQAETSIAVDSTGQHIVVGFNDTRGFSLNPISVSGFMYSDDGGKTFVDGGQLPTPGNQDIGAACFLPCLAILTSSTWAIATSSTRLFC